MSSDQADLIREADAALDGITPGPWTWAARTTADGDSWAVFDSADHALATNNDGWARDAEFIAAAPDLVRRLRDALEATGGDACGTCLAIARDARDERDAALALLAREQAALDQLADALDRVRELAEQYDDQCGSCGSISGGRSVAEDIRRAIEGPAS